MSDDTTRTDGWGSEETSSGTPEGTAQNQPQGQSQTEPQTEPQSAAARVGFCQDCGKPLTQATVRTVGTGVFCEPCLTTRVGASTPASGYATVPPYTAVPPQTAMAGEPSPVLAAILGFIPGVGAMYNGQFAKGIVHLAIFAILVSLSDNVNGIFGLFVAGWEFYMAFEAYHTAVARRDGLPLPNAFGFNDIGERMGFGKGWVAGSPKSAGSTVPPASNATPGAAPASDPAPGSSYGNTAAVGTAPDWVGYIPPTAFATPPPIPHVAPASASQPYGAWSHTPYAETYTGAPQAFDPAFPPTAAGRPDLATRRFPTSALWLIGLGVLILLANLLPDWRFTERWWPPVLFACLSIWTFTRRIRSGARPICILRWPVLLMVLAIMLALHAAYFMVTTALTCSVLLIVYGALLLLERTMGAGPVYIPPAPAATYPGSVAEAQAEEARSRAAWAAAGGNIAKDDPANTKDGQ